MAILLLRVMRMEDLWTSKGNELLGKKSFSTVGSGQGPFHQSERQNVFSFVFIGSWDFFELTTVGAARVLSTNQSIGMYFSSFSLALRIDNRWTFVLTVILGLSGDAPMMT